MDSPSKLLQNLFFIAKKHTLIFIPLLLCPLAVVIGLLYFKSLDLKEAAQTILVLEKKAIHLKERQKEEAQRWAAVEPGSLEALESLRFLIPEEHRLEALFQQFPHNQAIKGRLAFLKGDQNQIHFLQTSEKSGPPFQQREWKMQSPVQLNTEDLKNLLSAIESKNRLLIVKRFDLKKLREKTDEVVYSVETELIQKSP